MSVNIKTDLLGEGQLQQRVSQQKPTYPEGIFKHQRLHLSCDFLEPGHTFSHNNPLLQELIAGPTI